MAALRMSEIVHQHKPVLLNEVITHLITSKDGIYIDATFGRGSHAQAILNHLNATGRLIAFDQDPDAVQYAKKHFHDTRFTIIHAPFSHMKMCLQQTEIIGKVNGILFDLGVSSPQLDNPERGFSFMRDGKLDMRMNTLQGIDALTWLATIEEKELADVLWEYGEEKFSRRIARAIVSARAEKPIMTTFQLADIITQAMPRKPHAGEKHAATRSFQAIRMAINQELPELEKGLQQALALLAPGGRLLTISFHSLEDRLVKQFIRQHEKGKELPRGLPVKQTAFHAKLKTVTKAIKPSLSEIRLNPRSRSAILRIAEKQL
jgi:16S rRNA (cytosine1402-N4)-methyltransferase